MEKEKEFLDKCMMYLRRSIDQINEVKKLTGLVSNG